MVSFFSARYKLETIKPVYDLAISQICPDQRVHNPLWLNCTFGLLSRHCTTKILHCWVVMEIFSGKIEILYYNLSVCTFLLQKVSTTSEQLLVCIVHIVFCTMYTLYYRDCTNTCEHLWHCMETVYNVHVYMCQCEDTMYVLVPCSGATGPSVTLSRAGHPLCGLGGGGPRAMGRSWAKLWKCNCIQLYNNR